jgi:hypothetical protein
MNDTQDVVVVPEPTLDDEAALEAALSELAAGFAKLRQESR